MFTGIIREIGQVVRVRRRQDVVELLVRAPDTAAAVGPLESVSISGVCLTVVSARQGVLIFEVIPETQRLTSLGTVRAGDRVNVEPSLAVTGRFNGHVVFGHVDGVGTVMRRRQRDGELVLDIRVDRRLRPSLVSKGPVALDGVSLTVGRTIAASSFSVHLIPETLRQTTLGERRPGGRLNIELDYVAKLVRQYLDSCGPADYVSRRKLLTSRRKALA